MTFCSCGQEDVLRKYPWILVEATYNHEQLPLYSNDVVRVRSKSGSEFLIFGEDGNAVLPGLGFESVVANWRIDDGMIYFTPDSSRYALYGDPAADLSFLDTVDSFEGDDSVVSVTRKLHRELGPAMKFYSQPFVYQISRDTLMMVSTQTTLIAVRDKVLDNILRYRKPRRTR